MEEVHVNFTPSGIMVLRSGQLLVVDKHHQWQRRAIQRSRNSDIYDLEIQLWIGNFGQYSKACIGHNRIGRGNLDRAVRWVSRGCR